MSYIELPVLSDGAGFTTDGQGLLLNASNVLSLVLDGTSLSKSALGLKFNDASPQFIDVSSSSTAFRVTQRGTGAALIIEDSANPDASPFVIDASGRVAIGATSTTSKLLITENSASPAVRITQAGAGLCLLVEDAASPDSSPFAIDADGRVGIGTNAPTSRLSVLDDSTDPALYINQLGAGPALLVDDSTSPDSTPFVIDANGNVGIGTSNPQSKLVVLEPTSGGWSGRVVAGGTTNVFLLGEYDSKAWLGAHNATLTAWAPFYINPDGPQTLYLGAINSSQFTGPIITVANNPIDYNVGIKTNSTTPSLLITQQGSGHCLVVEDSTNPDGTPFVIDAEGRVGIGTSTPVSALHLAQAAGVAESATCLFAEKDTTPGNPADGTQVKMYMKADKIIFQYNDGGTVRYKYLDLTGTTDTWTATTTAP